MTSHSLFSAPNESIMVTSDQLQHIWTKTHDNHDTWIADISNFGNGPIVLPNGENASITEFTPRTTDNELTSWQMMRGMVKYVLWND